MPGTYDQSASRKLVGQVEILTTSTSLRTILSALVEVCYRNGHTCYTDQNHETAESMLKAEHWQAMAHRLTEMEKDAASYDL